MNKLRVVEAFSGIGSQKRGLENKNINHEVVATMEIDKYAIISYAAMHHDLEKHLDYENQNVKKEKEYLEKIGIIKVPRQKKRLHQCYIASKISNNLGDISKVDEENIPEHDLFTYSFPCQDISLLGVQKGLTEESKTKSSLLWECKKIIEKKKPSYLMLENVKNLISNTHKENFYKWLKWLETEGYNNYWKVLDAKNYNSAQHRERIFVFSIKKEVDKGFEFPKEIERNIFFTDILEDTVDEKYYLKGMREFFPKNSLKNETKGNGFRFKVFIKDNAKTALTVTTKAGSRMHDNFIIDVKHDVDKEYFEFDKESMKTEFYKKYIKNEPIRRLTPKECWRLTGFSDEKFEKAEKFNSDTQLYKQAGNSISVEVLENLFSVAFQKYIIKNERYLIEEKV